MSTCKPGRLIGASLGPGDPELITRRAWAALPGARVSFSIRTWKRRLASVCASESCSSWARRLRSCMMERRWAWASTRTFSTARPRCRPMLVRRSRRSPRSASSARSTNRS